MVGDGERRSVLDAACGREWRTLGEAACACCGARYRVEATPCGQRAADFYRCDVCGSVVDEWIDSRQRRFERLGAVSTPAAQNA